MKAELKSPSCIPERSGLRNACMLSWRQIPMTFSDSFFAVKFGMERRNLERYLSEALSQGGDYADLYFEYLATSTIGMDEGIVKTATQGVSLGVGVRVISGEKTGYAYSGDLSPEKIMSAARVAA